MAQSTPVYKPTKRGGGGLLKVLWWQGPTLLNPHFAVGTKDQDGSRFFYEPLAGWDADGNLKPVLAESIPGREDGTLAADGKSVVWKLKKGVKWHDGKPFTSEDVKFSLNEVNRKYDGPATTGFAMVKEIETPDPYTVVFRLNYPFAPFFPWSFTSVWIMPKHIYEGSDPTRSPANFKPVGTGPYKFKDFKPGDRVLADEFKPKDKVDVIGVSKGRGFAGVVRRHHFRGSDDTHGSMFHRAPGSIGASSFPSRVFPGMRMGGQMGSARVTVRNLEIIQVDAEDNVILVKGAVPGPNGGYLVLRRAKS